MSGDGITAPRCKLCGNQHWAREPHKYGKQPDVKPAKPKAKIPRRKK